MFIQQYFLQKGLKKFGARGKEAVIKEIKQLHNRNSFKLLQVSKMSTQERRRAIEALMFLAEKRDGTIKGRQVYNGKPTREWLSREDSASPTVSLESIFLTAAIDGKENRDVMTVDIPNAFIQTNMEYEEDEEKVVMKIVGILAEILISIDPEKYNGYLVMENGKKTLYVQVMKAIYGMLQAALLWYKKFRKDLEEYGFKFNEYDPCVANKIIRGKQQTI